MKAFFVRTRTRLGLGGLAVGLVLASVACTAVENAAKRDPMKCERDPKCEKKLRSVDCSRQCSDDPACVERCETVQQANGRLGR